MQQDKIDQFNIWYQWHGHWCYPSRDAAWQAYITYGINGLKDW